MKYLSTKKILKIIVIGIPLFSIFHSLYVLSVSDYTADNRFLYGLLLYLCGYFGLWQIEYYLTYLNFRGHQMSTIALGIIIFLSCFNLIVFSHIDVGFTIKLSELPTFGFNPICVILLIFYLIAYKKELNRIFESADSNSSKPKEETFEEDVNRFIQVYSDKSTRELSEIINNSDSYTTCAIEAFRRLLADKTNEL